MAASGTLSWNDRFDHFLARWGWKRSEHRVKPGLYRLGNPGPESPVIVTANYTLSFDAVRSSLGGANAYILVLDTKGINVWCAAGKGTFGTDELVNRINVTGLSSVVTHRKLVLPQLCAPGVSAHEVARKSGFRVDYGPVRAKDLPQFLASGKATPDLRKVDFPIADRLVLTPMETVHAALPMAGAAIALYLLTGPLGALAEISAVLSGTILFPALLPWLPGRDFSFKGLILGGIVGIPFAIWSAMSLATAGWAAAAAAAVPLLLIPAVTSYLALNFTGSTPFTSRTGVKTEIFRYVPVMAVMVVIGTAIAMILGFSMLLGVI